MQEKIKIALLIDCDNVSADAIEGVLNELAKYGVVNVRHAHGNWNSSSLSGWKEKLHPHAIRPIQQFAYTKGKNATDSAMIIDAMDLLYSNNVDAFALMTSDSDFTPLVLRLLESGSPVYGFGEAKTPKPFVDACSPFIFTENLITDQGSIGKNAKSKGPNKYNKKSKEDLIKESDLIEILRTAVSQSSGDDDWSNMSLVASYITNNNRAFSSLNYGYKKLGDLIRTTDLFDIEMRTDGKIMFLKEKDE